MLEAGAYCSGPKSVMNSMVRSTMFGGGMLNRRGLLAAGLLSPAGLVLPGRQALAARPRPHGGNDNSAKGISWPTALLMATGRPGGAYGIYGPAWGALAQQACGVSVAYLASGGAASDILLIEQGAAQLGMTTVTVADQAISGTGAWTAGVKLSSFRALFPIFPSVLQVMALEGSGITSLSALAGRRIGVGPDGGSGSVAIPALLRSLGAAPAACLTGDIWPQVRRTLAGELDACAFIGAPPLPAIQAAAQHHRLIIIGFTPEETERAVKAVPGITAMTIPEGIFANQSNPIASIGTENFAIGAARLPAGLVAALTTTAMRNRNKLAALVPAVAQSAKMALPQGEMSFHPGAALALRSFGLDVPAKFVES